MEILQLIAERKILEAFDAGFFNDLALKGKPLNLESLDGIPEELRMAFKILKDSGVLPEELSVKKEVVRLRQLVDACTEETEKLELRRRLRDEELRYNFLMERRRI
jgi:DnaJ-like protein